MISQCYIQPGAFAGAPFAAAASRALPGYAAGVCLQAIAINRRGQAAGRRAYVRARHCVLFPLFIIAAFIRHFAGLLLISGAIAGLFAIPFHYITFYHFARFYNSAEIQARPASAIAVSPQPAFPAIAAINATPPLPFAASHYPPPLAFRPINITLRFPLLAVIADSPIILFQPPAINGARPCLIIAPLLPRYRLRIVIIAIT